MNTDRDAGAQVGLTRREVRPGARGEGETKVVVSERTYRAEPSDLWDAITNPQRLPRWFLPITGDLRVGGTYQLQGNAGGTIEQCREPELLAVTWEFMGGVSWLEVQLTRADQGTTLELRHECSVDDHWRQFGPGATGVGFDLGLLGLGLHLRDGVALAGDEFQAWTLSAEGKEFVRESSDGWGAAAIAAGEDADRALARAEQTRAFFTGDAGAADAG